VTKKVFKNSKSIVNPKFLPFESMHCNSISCGSPFKENDFQLDLKLKEEPVDLGTYVLNGEWHLLGRTRRAGHFFCNSFSFHPPYFASNMDFFSFLYERYNNSTAGICTDIALRKKTTMK
jgi:hypothetical protein